MTSLFPEQTKTIPRIIVWSIIFLPDLILGFSAAIHWGLFQHEKYHSSNSMMLGAGLLTAVIVGIFRLQSFLWFSLVKAVRKSTEPDDISPIRQE